MDWYWLISNNNDNLLNELLKEIEQDGIKPLGDWRAVYNKGYDGYLVNMVYNIIANDKLSSKDEIAVELYNLLKPLYASVGAITKEDFNNIVDNIWCCNFGKNKSERKTIRELASMNQPPFRKLVNTNGFMTLFTILVLVLSALIGGVYSFIGLLFLIYIGLNAISHFGLIKGYLLAFVLMVVLSFFGSFLVSPNEAIEWNKCMALSFVISLSFIPVLKINWARITEKKKNI
jgi:hypothetical protein